MNLTELWQKSREECHPAYRAILDAILAVSEENHRELDFCSRADRFTSYRKITGAPDYLIGAACGWWAARVIQQENEFAARQESGVCTGGNRKE